jgi:Tfp pilus assembly protein PilF
MTRLEKLKEFLQQQPGDPFLNHALALEYIKLDDDIQAEKIFLSILAADENYFGSYYHLAKLYERTNRKEAAIAIYEKGIAVCKKLGETHALGELKSAYEELIF